MDYESRGQRFESFRARHLFNIDVVGVFSVFVQPAVEGGRACSLSDRKRLASA